jgi:hypothetical protein
MLKIRIPASGSHLHDGFPKEEQLVLINIRILFWWAENLIPTVSGYPVFLFQKSSDRHIRRDSHIRRDTQQKNIDFPLYKKHRLTEEKRENTKLSLALFSMK